MKFFSEILNKNFDTEIECVRAEKEFEKKKREDEKKAAELKAKRSERAKEVEDALKEYLDAKKKYDKLLSDFCKDFKSFHMTIDDKNISRILEDEIFDLFKWLF